MVKIIRMPRLSANEDEAEIEWVIEAGKKVRQGSKLGVIETIKATTDLTAEMEGYFFPVIKGGKAKVGEVIAVLAKTPKIELEKILKKFGKEKSRQGLKRRWTKKAEILAKRAGIDIAKLDIGKEIITESDIRAIIAQEKKDLSEVKEKEGKVLAPFLSRQVERILLLGASALVLDAVLRSHYQIPVGILDDYEKLVGKRILGVPVLGPIRRVEELFSEGFFDKVVIAIGIFHMDFRRKLFEELEGKGIPFANIIHPTALIESNVTMGTGNIILGFCRIGTCTQIGNNNLFSAYTNIEHHNVIGSHCATGPGVITSGKVRIGDSVSIGTGVFIEPRLTIGSNSTIASGAIITTDIAPNSLVKTRISYVIREKMR